MAILNGIIQYTGKLGETVGMKGTNGRNYLRKKVTPRNTRSTAQCIQRMIMATVATSISKLTAVCDNSVEGIQHGNPTLSYLKGQWMRMLRTERLLTPNQRGYSYLKKGENRFSANPYQLSKGSLAGVPLQGFSLTSGTPFFYDVDSRGACTFSDIFPYAKLGDQITLVQVLAHRDGRTEVHYCRFAAVTNSAPLVMENGTRLNPAVLDLSKCSGPWDQIEFGYRPNENTPDTDEYLMGFSFLPVSALAGEAVEEDDVKGIAAAVLVSNKEDEKRSTSYMVINPDIDVRFKASVAYPTYGDTATPMNVPSDIYLNNSTEPDELGLAVIQTPESAFPFAATSKNYSVKFGAKPTSVYFELRGDGGYLLSNDLLNLPQGNNFEGSGSGHVVCTTAPSYDDATNVLTFATGQDEGQHLYVTGGFAIINGERVDIFAAQ